MSIKHNLIVILAILVIVVTFFAITKPEGRALASVEVPGDLSAVADDGSVTLTWSAPRSGDAPQGYLILRNNPNGTIDTRSTDTSFRVTGLTNGVEYTFAVAGYDRDGTGPYSESVRATPAAKGVTEPSEPVLTSATPGDSEVSLTWSTPSDGGSPLTGYRIAVVAGRDTTSVDVGLVNSHTVTGLTNGVAYDFMIVAINEIGSSKNSNILSATPQGVVSVPSAPSITNITAGDGSLILTLGTPLSDGGSPVTGYTISYSPDQGVEQLVSVGDVKTYTISNLTNGVMYTVKVAAENAQGLSQYSTERTATPAGAPGVPANLTVTPGDQSLSISWDAPNNNGSPIIRNLLLYTPAGGRETVLQLDGAVTSYLLENLVNGVSYEIRIRAINDIGEGRDTAPVSGAPDTDSDPVVVGSPQTFPNDTTARIVWQTNKFMSTRVDFGLLDVTARSTTETNTSTKVLNHEVLVSNLVPCTTYSYRVFSRDSLLQTAVSATQAFTTTGCEGDALVKTVERQSLRPATGGQLDFTDTVNAKLTVPANVVTAQNDIVFQVKKLEKEDVQAAIDVPTATKRWLGDHAYKLSAYISETEEIEDFDEPVRVTIEYGIDDITGINRDTLLIYHYRDAEEGWHALENCTNVFNDQTGVGVISCDTPNFSVFGLFGEPEPTSGGSTSTGVFVPIEQVQNMLSQSESADAAADDSNALDSDESMVENQTYVFMQDLWRGLNNSLDVFNLQKFLNAQGFILANEGPGSPGRETSYFGPRTHNALKRFQEAYADQILLPIGLTKPTGYFGILTRTFIQQNF